MDYDPQDYAVDARDVWAGFCLLGMALLGILVTTTSVGETTAASPLLEQSVVADNHDFCDDDKSFEEEI
ncbi:hypothetical protein [Rhizobium leguminosarum]|uniref:hypothetical protein n=1 Tax=Rhizobium leguminosarum TaxID=384 RepID=UPI001C9583CE|nr:hypothetical protein [Rhizobium leguminosarum]MBY5827827.1 hypothetical protein [Rhizobium leguminosarum]